MKISRRDLNTIIENFLLLEKVSEDIISSEFKKALAQIKKEVMSLSNISESNRKKVSDILDRTHLYIVPADDPISNSKDLMGVDGYARHLSFSPSGERFKETIDDSIIKDETLKSAYNAKPITNPIVVIVQKNVKDTKALQQLLLHEIGHIKNNFLKITEGITLNVEEIRNLLRKDFQGKSAIDIMNTLKSENRIDKTRDNTNTIRLIKAYKRYYDGVFADPPDEMGVDEFAVRVAELKRDTDILDAISLNAAEVMTLNQMDQQYGSDVAGLALFLDKDATSELINKVAKVKRQDAIKSVTV